MKGGKGDVDRRHEVGVAGDPETLVPDRLDVCRPRVDRPHLDTWHPGEVGGVQAADRATAEQLEKLGLAEILRVL